MVAMAQNHLVRMVFRVLAALAASVMLLAQDAPPAPERPEPLTVEQRAQVYKILFEMRDSAARGAELREQAQQADAQAKAKQDEFGALHQQLSGETGCRLDQNLEWQCQPTQQ